MRRLAWSVAIGALVALVALPVITSPSFQHPPICSWASTVGDFCLTWDAGAGHYVGLPRGVPADIVRGRDDPTPPAATAAVAVAILLLAALATWAVLGLWSRRRGSTRPASAGS